MKKIIALVLALVMTLSLLPMTVWATEGEQTTKFTSSGDTFNPRGVFIFTEKTGSVLSYNGTLTERNGYVTVPCASNAPEKLYLAVSMGDGLKVNGTQRNDPVGTCTATFNNGDNSSFTADCNVYELDVPVYDDEFEIPYSVMRTNSEGTEDFEGFTLIFDYTPVFTCAGSTYDFNNVFIFTGKTDSALSYNGTITRRGDQSGEYVTVPCAANAPKKLYLAVYEGDKLTVGGVQQENPIGKWSTTFQNGNKLTCNVYEIDVLPASADLTAKTTVIRTWTWYENGVANTESASFNLIFDYAPVFTVSGDAFAPYGVFVFTGKTDSTLTYNGAVSQWGDQTGEHVTVYCMPETSKTVYLAVSPWQSLSMDGLQLVGRWNKLESNDQGDSWIDTYNIYSLTASKPQNGTTVERAATITYGDGGVNNVTYIFDFENYPNQLWRYQWDSWTTETAYIDRGTTGNIKLALGTPISRTVFTSSNCTKIETVEDIGTVSWSADGTEILLDTSTASEQAGSIKVTYDGTTFQFPVRVNFRPLFIKNGENYDNWADAENGFIYNWELYYEQWNQAAQKNDRIKITKDDFYLVGFTASGTTLPSGTFIWEDDGTVTFDSRAVNADVYPIELIAIDNSTGAFNSLDISDGYRNEDRTCWKTYKTNANTVGDYQYGGNSIFVVRMTPLQAQFIDLPDKLTEDNELIVTVHNPSEAAWREMLDQDMGTALFYHFECLKGEGTSGEMPVVKSLAGSADADWFFEWLDDPEYEYSAYNSNSSVRHNGAIFAWTANETDRTVIIPQESEIRSAWVWKYSDGTELADSVVVKVVLADDVSNAVMLDDTPFYDMVDADRVAIDQSHTNLNTVFDASYDETTGVLTYRYTGPVTSTEIQGYPSTVINKTVLAKVTADKLLEEGREEIVFPLLTVSTPKAGYTAKAINNEPYWNSGSATMEINYCWRGVNITHVHTLTWENAAGDTIVEQITINTPTVSGVENWLDHINDGNVSRIPADRVIVTELTEETCGAENVITDGFLYTQFNEDVMLDAGMIYDATVGVAAPTVSGQLPVAFKAIAQEDGGRDDPTYNIDASGNAANSKMILDASKSFELKTEEATGVKRTMRIALDALLEQNIGDIQYYYSGDRGTRTFLIKWIFDLENEDEGAIYEYMIFDTESYYCIWTTDAEESVDEPVTKPTVIIDDEIKLVTRVHPQEMEDQYFFEMHVTDKEGDAITKHEGKYKILLPYSFMGRDEHGKDIWDFNKVKAKGLKAPCIKHYHDDYGVREDITGKYTEHGIEFEVDSFSPFMLTWDETENTTPSYGGYYPVVTPNKDTTTETKPTETKPVVTPTTTPSVEETVTPEVEDTTPVVPDEPIVDDPVVDEAPADDVEQNSGNAGLWIGIGIVALAAIVVVLAVMAARKKRK